MKQVVQNLASGATEVLEMPVPRVKRGTILVATSRSLISTGTERLLVEFGRAGLLQKAKLQPERVRMVLERARTDGVLATIDAVKSKLDQPIALGYCNVGRVVAVGEGVRGLKVGDRVASNGPHAEVVRVPVNLCAKVPESVADDVAVFTVPASIALQGMRLAAPTLGETFVVIGLGLIGLLAVQLLRANGCHVIGVDLDASRLALAESFGALVVSGVDAAEVEAFVAERTSGIGADGVLLAAATSSSEPMRTAAHVCRKRGRIVLVGVTGLELSRADFYEKELTFQVSCSYGPGRYDPSYEEEGNDYPIGYVRWTEQRNFEAVLQVMSAGRLQVNDLVSHQFELEDAVAAYDVLSSKHPALAIVLTYPEQSVDPATVIQIAADRVDSSNSIRAGFIGAGNYASRVLLPSFKRAGVGLAAIATTGSVQGVHSARKFGFERATSDADSVLSSPDVNLAVIATRHNSHAALAMQALRAGKHVFVEKPLALSTGEVDEFEQFLLGHTGEPRPTLTVGFNRRFAPLISTVTKLLARRRGPKSFIYTVNAGAIPPDHWTQDPEVGGGRIIGEVCHFIDLLRFLAGSKVEYIDAVATPPLPPQPLPDNVVVNMRFEDGSVGSIQYFSNGARQFPKERVEVFMGGSVLRLDNFKRLDSFGWPRFSGQRLWRQDKGHDAMVAALKSVLEIGGGQIIPAEELLEVARVTIRAAEAALRHY